MTENTARYVLVENHQQGSEAAGFGGRGDQQFGPDIHAGCCGDCSSFGADSNLEAGVARLIIDFAGPSQDRLVGSQLQIAISTRGTGAIQNRPNDAV